jgi:hypothetical protein
VYLTANRSIRPLRSAFDPSSLLSELAPRTAPVFLNKGRDKVPLGHK